MAKVAVVFWSGTDNTEQMADAVALGVKENGGETSVFRPADFSAEKMDEFVPMFEAQAQCRELGKALV